jgi:hypothetical protein
MMIIPPPPVTHQASEYRYAKFGSAPNTLTSAEQTALRFMEINYRVLGIEKFTITDDRLFAFTPTNNNKVKKQLKFSKKSKNNANNSLYPTPSAYELVEICIDITSTSTSYHCNHLGTCANGPCDLCYLCVSSATSTTSYCNSWWVATSGSGGGTGGNSGGGPGGPGGGSGGGGTSGGGTGWVPNVADITEIADLLTAALQLDGNQRNWLELHPYLAIDLLNYVQNSNNRNEIQISREHLDQLMTDVDYLGFIENYNTNTSTTLMWWENTAWLDNSNNFKLNVDDQSYDLNSEEKLLCTLFPVQAYRIFKNVNIAYNKTDEYMGIQLRGLNDKKDAFRHAFFNAINTRSVSIGTRDIPERGIFNEPVPKATIVRMFANAHESNVPPLLYLEKNMDLFNNEVGIGIFENCQSCNGFTDNIVAGIVLSRLVQGELRHIFPLNYVTSKDYDGNKDGYQDCTNCLDGILPNSTIIPTN